MLDLLFKFPIVMLDGDNEERKKGNEQRYGDIPGFTGDGVEVDLIMGEAECPFDDFLAVADRWLPTAESLDKAINGEFEACYVIFASSGSFIVPWNKEKFKKKLKEFMDKVPPSSVRDGEISFFSHDD